MSMHNIIEQYVEGKLPSWLIINLVVFWGSCMHYAQRLCSRCCNAAWSCLSSYTTWVCRLGTVKLIITLCKIVNFFFIFLEKKQKTD